LNPTEANKPLAFRIPFILQDVLVYMATVMTHRHYPSCWEQTKYTQHEFCSSTWSDGGPARRQRGTHTAAEIDQWSDLAISSCNQFCFNTARSTWRRRYIQICVAGKLVHFGDRAPTAAAPRLVRAFRLALRVTGPGDEWVVVTRGAVYWLPPPTVAVSVRGGLYSAELRTGVAVLWRNNGMRSCFLIADRTTVLAASPLWVQVHRPPICACCCENFYKIWRCNLKVKTLKWVHITTICMQTTM
jgi:hypothetical protein